MSWHTGRLGTLNTTPSSPTSLSVKSFLFSVGVYILYFPFVTSGEAELDDKNLEASLSSPPPPILTQQQATVKWLMEASTV